MSSQTLLSFLTFDEDEILPTFNHHTIAFHLFNITDLTEEFVFINEHTTLIGEVDLSYFKYSDAYNIHYLGMRILPIGLIFFRKHSN